MGTFNESLFTVDDDYFYQIHAVNMPASIAEVLSPEELRMEIHDITENEIEGVKTQLENRDTDLLIIFPLNFDEDVAAFDPATAEAAAPNVQIWSNMARTESSDANRIVKSLLDAYHFALTHRFSVNAPTDEVPDGNFNLATDADMFRMIMGMMIPLLFLIFIFTGCQSLAPESIAGEKERGTLGSVLVTPTNRRDIALGKILGIAFFSLLSAVVSILGALLALPSMMTGMETGGIFEIFSVTDMLLLFIVASSTTLVFVSLLSVLSAYAKSVKEAAAYAMPIMFVVMVASLASMFFDSTPEDIVYFVIPVMNSALSISAIFTAEINIVNILTATVVNLLIAVTFTLILAKIFSSEKIVFDK
jgi:sodium transport system permease protein